MAVTDAPIIDPIQTSLSAFVDALRLRFQRGIHTTEDAVRYTFFVSLLNAFECGPERLILEYPYPISGSRLLIDAWILPLEGQSAIALEFKFHRRPPESYNRPRTMLAGAVVKDLFKLANIPSNAPLRRIFVYVYGLEMHVYFSNPSNGMAGLIEASAGKSYVLDEEFLEGKSATFRSNAGTVYPCAFKLLKRDDIQGHFRLRAYEVEPVQS